MQRIMIVSDSHRRHGNLAEAIYNEQPFDLLIHLGDIEGEEDIIQELAAAVEGISGDAAEVADTGQSDAEQTLQELPHLVLTQGHLGANGHALTDLEVSDALLGLGDDGVLAGDLAQIGDDGVQHLGVLARLGAADVDDDLIQTGDLHGGLIAELAHQSRSDFFLILRFQSRHLVALLSSDFGAALLADADLLAISQQLVSRAGGLVALGADALHLAGVNGGFHLHDAALLGLAGGLLVLGSDVDALHNDLTLGRNDRQDLALLALVLAGQNDDEVVLLNADSVHYLGALLKSLREPGTGSS